MCRKHLYLFLIFILCMVLFISCNPFAPGVVESSEGILSSRGDQRTTEGVFQNLQYAYNITMDTSDYGKLFDGNFLFTYPDYDLGGYIWWGRAEEMRATYGLFKNVQHLDLTWNDTVYTKANAENTETEISRRFKLTITFNPSDIITIYGNAVFQMTRQRSEDPWMIVQWRDESNY